VADSILQIGPDYQWDADSRYPLPDPGSAPANCGPACSTNIVKFHTGRDHGIYANRRLVVPASEPNRGTSAGEQAAILTARGVPASVRVIETRSELIDLVGYSGRRPVTIGVLMGRIPLNVRDHPFTGWHAIVIMARGNGGWYWRDPNFNRTYRIDPDGGTKWMNDATLDYAYFSNTPRYGVVSDAAKVVTPSTKYVTLEPGAALRINPTVTALMSPSHRLHESHRVPRAGAIREGGAYSWYDSTGRLRTGRDWVPVLWAGKYKRWVALPFASATLDQRSLGQEDALGDTDEGLLEFGAHADGSPRTFRAGPRGATADEAAFIISEPVDDEPPQE
jgi:hypothetical protein